MRNVLRLVGGSVPNRFVKILLLLLLSFVIFNPFMATESDIYYLYDDPSYVNKNMKMDYVTMRQDVVVNALLLVYPSVLLLIYLFFYRDYSFICNRTFHPFISRRLKRLILLPIKFTSHYVFSALESTLSLRDVRQPLYDLTKKGRLMIYEY